MCSSLPRWEGGPSPTTWEGALSAVLDWSDPARLSHRPGSGHVWQGVPREKWAGLMAAVLAGEKLPGISPHDLRHTFATLALRRGVPVEVVSKVLGHGRAAITLTVYRHVIDNERRATVVNLFPTGKRPQPSA